MATKFRVRRKLRRSRPPVRRSAGFSAGNRIDGKQGQDRDSSVMIGGVNDPAEKQADKVADQVMRMPDRSSAPATQDEGDDTVRTKTAPSASSVATGTSASAAPSSAATAIKNLGSGRRLASAENAFFSPRLSADLSKVRVHDDARADQAAQAINARAFARGNHIVFAGGEYSPDTHEGKRLIAHELAHVVGDKKQIIQRKAEVKAEESPKAPTSPEEFDRVSKRARELGGDVNFRLETHFDHSTQSGSIVLLSKGYSLVLTYVDGTWHHNQTYAGSKEFKARKSGGPGLPLAFEKENSSTVLENIYEIGGDFVPFYGSGRDIYRGVRDGDGWQIAIGVGGMALDVVTLGGSSLVKGGVKTIAKQGAKKLAVEAAETSAKQLLESEAKTLGKAGLKEGTQKYVAQKAAVTGAKKIPSVPKGAKNLLKKNRILKELVAQIEKEAIENPRLLFSHLSPGRIRQMKKGDFTFANIGHAMESELKKRLAKLYPDEFIPMAAGRGQKSVDFCDIFGLRFDLTSDVASTYFLKIEKYQKSMGIRSRYFEKFLDPVSAIQKTQEVSVNVIQYSRASEILIQAKKLGLLD